MKKRSIPSVLKPVEELYAIDRVERIEDAMNNRTLTFLQNG